MAEDITKKSVAVLVGGWSDEREVSKSSGAACAKALREAGFEQVDVMDVADEDFVQRISGGSYDVAFVAMHGRYGEDGCIQGLLEVLHIPYTFSGVAASACATQKGIAKVILGHAGIPVPEGIEIAPGEELDDEELDEIAVRLGLPLFVKPAANGSSFGITRVTEAAQLADAIALAAQGSDAVLVEQCVQGTEITVPVIGNDRPRALPAIEIVTGAEFYDTKVKYESSDLHHVIPARLSEDVLALASERACHAHVALGCKGASRADFIVTEAGEPVLLEVNNIPGMTEQSLLPDSARHAGIEFPELCRMFVELACEDCA